VGINGTGVIGFVPPILVDEDAWMANEDIKATIHDIHVRVIRLDEQRIADVNEVSDLKANVARLEARLWIALAGAAGAMGAAILSLLV
jgi:hypothetical protein